jgi:hypothetical protein
MGESICHHLVQTVQSFSLFFSVPKILQDFQFASEPTKEKWCRKIILQPTSCMKELNLNHRVAN